MEKRINIRVSNYIKDFKNNLNSLIINNLNNNDNKISQTHIQEIIQYIYNYETLEFTPQDFQKRKRVKNIVPLHSRCIALRANEQQCTRRRKGDSMFCGTHIKGTPHGKINGEKPVKTHIVKQVFPQEIKGIIYYIDDTENVYDPVDIIENKKVPKIIAKYVKINDEYSIPSLS
jgi:hypothetical protein